MATGPVLYTGNNVDIYIDHKLFGFVETLTISRSVNRQNVYAVGSPIRKDAPVTQATVTIQANNLVPITSNKTLQTPGANIITNSLASQVSESGHLITVQAQNSNVVLASATNCLYNDDAQTVPNTAILAYNISWSADDTNIFVANN